MAKPVTHPLIRARLQKLARRVRFEGEQIKQSEPSSTESAATAAFGLLPVGDSVPLWHAEREAAHAWCEYAAEILEAGAGGPAPSGPIPDGSDGDEQPRRHKHIAGASIGVLVAALVGHFVARLLTW